MDQRAISEPRTEPEPTEDGVETKQPEVKPEADESRQSWDEDEATGV